MDASQDQHALVLLYSQRFLAPSPNDASNQLWECFKNAFYKNKQGQDGRIRILSIVANEFTHAELEERLGVSKLRYLKNGSYKLKLIYLRHISDFFQNYN